MSLCVGTLVCLPNLTEILLDDSIIFLLYIRQMNTKRSGDQLKITRLEGAEITS